MQPAVGRNRERDIRFFRIFFAVVCMLRPVGDEVLLESAMMPGASLGCVANGKFAAIRVVGDHSPPRHSAKRRSLVSPCGSSQLNSTWPSAREVKRGAMLPTGAGDGNSDMDADAARACKRFLLRLAIARAAIRNPATTAILVREILPYIDTPP